MEPNAKPIRRSPRLLKGSEASRLEQLLWKKPEFHVSVTTEPITLEFRFKIRVSSEVLTQYPVIKSLFSVSVTEDLERALSHSYWKAASGKSLSLFISNLLHLVFHNALEQWFSSGWDFDTPKRAALDKKNYKRLVKSKRGQQPDPILALSICQRLETLTHKLVGMRKAYRTRRFRGFALWSQAEQIAPREVLQKALLQLVGNRENVEALFVDKRLTAIRIALEILRAELGETIAPRPKRKAVLLETYVKLGNSIRRGLRRLPKV